MNLFLHTANSLLLFLLLLYMTGYLGRSAIVAFLFALHPAHVESVAWLAERKDVLCTFFWFATLLAYTWYLRKPSWRRYLLIICGYACALMSKPMAVTLPVTMLLLDYWPLCRITFAQETRDKWFSSQFKLFIEKWPLFIMAAISSVITFIAQRSGGSVAELQSLPLLVRLCNVAIGYCRYLLLTFLAQSAHGILLLRPESHPGDCRPGIGRCAYRYYRGLLAFSGGKTLLLHWLVMVFGDVSARHRLCTGW